jgi:hypothetical protein
LGNLFNILADPAVDFFQKVPHQQFDIFPMLSQRRHGDGVDLEAVKQVGPEASLFDFILQDAVGGGDDTHIHRVGRLSPPTRSN